MKIYSIQKSGEMTGSFVASRAAACRQAQEDCDRAVSYVEIVVIEHDLGEVTYSRQVLCDAASHKFVTSRPIWSPRVLKRRGTKGAGQAG